MHGERRRPGRRPRAAARSTRSAIAICGSREACPSQPRYTDDSDTLYGGLGYVVRRTRTRHSEDSDTPYGGLGYVMRNAQLCEAARGRPRACGGGAPHATESGPRPLAHAHTFARTHAHTTRPAGGCPPFPCPPQPLAWLLHSAYSPAKILWQAGAAPMPLISAKPSLALKPFPLGSVFLKTNYRRAIVASAEELPSSNIFVGSSDFQEILTGKYDVIDKALLSKTL